MNFNAKRIFLSKKRFILNKKRPDSSAGSHPQTAIHLNFDHAVTNHSTKIYEIRGQQVMLDFDLAELYETETKRLKEAVKRNPHRFPADFMFELTKEEYDFLRTQFAFLENSGRGKHSKYLPFAFTEQGVAMLVSVLTSPKAITNSIGIIRSILRNEDISEERLFTR